MSFWVSLDGYSCDEGTELSDAMERISDDEHEAHFASGLRRAGTHIMGRGTYLGMSAFWPGSDHPFAAPMNDIPKVVFSATLQTAGWSEARIARGGMAREIARLKEEPGGEIVAHGGVRFVQSLTRLGLVDEYRLTVLPFAVGEGTPLFAGLTHPLALRQVSSTAFPSGMLEVVYRPAGDAGSP